MSKEKNERKERRGQEGGNPDIDERSWQRREKRVVYSYYITSGDGKKNCRSTVEGKDTSFSTYCMLLIFFYTVKGEAFYEVMATYSTGILKYFHRFSWVYFSLLVYPKMAFERFAGGGLLREKRAKLCRMEGISILLPEIDWISGPTICSVK